MKTKFKHIKPTDAQINMVKLVEDFGLTLEADAIINDIEFIRHINKSCEDMRSLADECARSIERQLYHYYRYEILQSAK